MRISGVCLASRQPGVSSKSAVRGLAKQARVCLPLPAREQSSPQRTGLLRPLHLIPPFIFPPPPHTHFLFSCFSCLFCLHVRSSHFFFSFARTLVQPLAYLCTLHVNQVLGHLGCYKEIWLIGCLCAHTWFLLNATTYTCLLSSSHVFFLLSRLRTHVHGNRSPILIFHLPYGWNVCENLGIIGHR